MGSCSGQAIGNIVRLFLSAVDFSLPSPCAVSPCREPCLEKFAHNGNGSFLHAVHQAPLRCASPTTPTHRSKRTARRGVSRGRSTQATVKPAKQRTSSLSCPPPSPASPASSLSPSLTMSTVHLHDVKNSSTARSEGVRELNPGLHTVRFRIRVRAVRPASMDAKS